MNKIDQFIQDGRYSNPSQFINTAIENQFMLEEGDLGYQETPVTVPKEPSDKYAGIKTSTPKASTTLGIDLFAGSISTLPMPEYKELVWSANDKGEENAWIWGQLNRLLPVKVGARVLMNMQAKVAQVSLKDFVQLANQEASTLGSQIFNDEKAKGKKRGEKISAGLPQLKQEKSQKRYKAHFLVYKRGDGLLDGALALMKFVNISADDKGDSLISLTQPGVQFAEMVNPVIDAGNFNKSLSDEEVEFYLDHIRRNVRGEYNAVKWLLESVVSGTVTREGLNEKLMQDYGEIWDATNSVVNTQRAGLTSRVTEMNLIGKSKQGVNVRYYVTDTGKSFLKK